MIIKFMEENILVNIIVLNMHLMKKVKNAFYAMHNPYLYDQHFNIDLTLIIQILILSKSLGLSIYCLALLSSYKYITCDFTHISDYPCFKTSGPGPHPIACLTAWWIETGCSVLGTASPTTNPSLVYWQERDVQAVKDDMAVYFRYASDGISVYIAKCYGDPQI